MKEKLKVKMKTEKTPFSKRLEKVQISERRRGYKKKERLKKNSNYTEEEKEILEINQKRRKKE